VGEKPLSLILQSENPLSSGTLEEAKDIAEKITTLGELYPDQRFQLLPFKYVRTDDGGMSLESVLAVAIEPAPLR
jgi:hypothetical protein